MDGYYGVCYLLMYRRGAKCSGHQIHRRKAIKKTTKMQHRLVRKTVQIAKLYSGRQRETRE
jgi:hypothetical protein